MVTGIAVTLFEFQEKAVMKLLSLAADPGTKQTITMKAPTGSGKTVILISFIDEYTVRADSNTAFIWLCPGKGNLEEQSRAKMEKLAPHCKTLNLFDALEEGFSPGSTTFINWELVTKKGNTAIRDSERKTFLNELRMRTAAVLNLLSLLTRSILTIPQRQRLSWMLLPLKRSSASVQPPFPVKIMNPLRSTNKMSLTPDLSPKPYISMTAWKTEQSLLRIMSAFWIWQILKERRLPSVISR